MALTKERCSGTKYILFISITFLIILIFVVIMSSSSSWSQPSSQIYFSGSPGAQSCRNAGLQKLSGIYLERNWINIAKGTTHSRHWVLWRTQSTPVGLSRSFNKLELLVKLHLGFVWQKARNTCNNFDKSNSSIKYYSKSWSNFSLVCLAKGEKYM